VADDRIEPPPLTSVQEWESQIEADLAALERAVPRKFTDYVLTLEGGVSPDVFSFLDRIVVPTLETITELDVGLASHTCNDDGDTYHSLLARNKILEERLEELLAERNRRG
jgi:hypothetical protein